MAQHAPGIKPTNQSPQTEPKLAHVSFEFQRVLRAELLPDGPRDPEVALGKAELVQKEIHLQGKTLQGNPLASAHSGCISPSCWGKWTQRGSALEVFGVQNGPRLGIAQEEAFPGHQSLSWPPVF